MASSSTRISTKPRTSSNELYSGAGATFCTLCPEGTTSEVASSACSNTDAGYVAAPSETYTITIESSVTLSNVSAANLTDDDLDGVQDALTSILVDDSYSESVDTTVISVGPATDVDGRRLDETSTTSSTIPFEVASNYSAATGENISDATTLLQEEL